MLRKKVNPVRVMSGKRFVAAYTPLPIAEEQNRAQYPDYAFGEVNGMSWCVRVGEIEVPWGFGKSEGLDYSASGSFTVSRRNLGAESFDGKGMPYVKCGEVFYLYECEIGDDGLRGFNIYLRNRLMPDLLRIAKKSTPETLEIGLCELGDDPDVIEVLDELGLDLIRVNLRKINKENYIRRTEN